MLKINSVGTVFSGSCVRETVYTFVCTNACRGLFRGAKITDRCFSRPIDGKQKLINISISSNENNFIQ